MGGAGHIPGVRPPGLQRALYLQLHGGAHVPPASQICRGSPLAQLCHPQSPAAQLSSRTRCSRQAVLGSVPAECAGVSLPHVFMTRGGWARPLLPTLPHADAALSRWLRPHPRHSLMHIILGTHWIPSSFSSHTCPAQAFQSRMSTANIYPLQRLSDLPNDEQGI